MAVTVYVCRHFTEFMEEMKKTICANFCSSTVQAMKVEIEVLKNGATDSGNNLASSQNSDLVPGNNPPPSKRIKTVSEATDSSEDEARDEEKEPPVDLHSTGGNGESAKLVEMSEETAAFIAATGSS